MAAALEQQPDDDDVESERVFEANDDCQPLALFMYLSFAPLERP